MKKKRLKSLELKKKSISNLSLETYKIIGGNGDSTAGRSQECSNGSDCCDFGFQ